MSGNLNLVRAIALIGSFGFLGAAVGAPDYNLHCKFSGPVVEAAAQTVPARNADDKTVDVSLHLNEAADTGFYTTGADYFAKFILGQSTVLVYLHSSGYGFPMAKTIGLSVLRPNQPRVWIFNTDVPDGEYTTVESSVLKTLAVPGLNQLSDLDTALMIVCNDFGSN